MARIPQVTRTIATTKVNVICMDLDNVEPFNKDIVVPRTYKDEAKLMKVVSAMIDDEHTKAVKIAKAEEVTTLYGMTEEKFIANADILDPETRKAIAE